MFALTEIRAEEHTIEVNGKHLTDEQLRLWAECKVYYGDSCFVDKEGTVYPEKCALERISKLRYLDHNIWRTESQIPYYRGAIREAIISKQTSATIRWYQDVLGEYEKTLAEQKTKRKALKDELEKDGCF